MAIEKKRDSEENRAFWDFVEQTSLEVETSFPTWKRGDQAGTIDQGKTDPMVERHNKNGNQSSGNCVFD